MTDRPTILFACIHNSGRSVAAERLAQHYAGDRVMIRSAGSDPSGEVNAVVAEVLAERGLPVTHHTPTRLDRDLVERSDVVISMGCGESCPYVPGKRYEDWDVADPAGQDVETVRRIVADIDGRVQQLIGALLGSPSSASPRPQDHQPVTDDGPRPRVGEQ